MIGKPLLRLAFLHLMCNSKKAIHHSSLTSLTVIRLFKASLLCVSLVSSFYVHFSLILLVLNVVFICKEMSSQGRVLVEAKEKEAVERKRLQINEDEGSNVVDGHDDDDHHHQQEEIRNENDDFTSLKESELGDDASDSISEEDYLIEIRPPEKWFEAEAEAEADEDFLNQISGEDNLIEIDISMGSIRT